MKWLSGRQGTGYFKLKLLNIQWPFGMDVYVLKYPKGSSIPFHTDPVKGKRHYRLNIVLWNALGGHFRVKLVPRASTYIFRTPRIVLFRPDVVPHSVSEVMAGTRYVLSVGWTCNL